MADQGQQLSKNVIVIGGSQRSGTTLLHILLCQDPATNPYAREASFLLALLQNCHREATQPADFFKDKQRLGMFQARAVNTFFAEMALCHPRASTLVVKEPLLTPYIPAVHSGVPNARFICMVRDPRDTITSMIKVGEAMNAARRPPYLDRKNIDAMCSHFLSFYAPLLNNQSAPFAKRTLLIRYEDLVKDTDTVLSVLRKATGLALEIDTNKELQTGNVNFQSQSKETHPWFSSHYGKKISDSPLGNYKEVLSSQELAAVEKRCAGFLTAFKYQNSP